MAQITSTYKKEIRKAATAANLPLEKLQGKNIKLTTQDDLELFKGYLNTKK